MHAVYELSRFDTIINKCDIFNFREECFVLVKWYRVKITFEDR